MTLIKTKSAQGYDAVTIEESGTHPEYGKYDARQISRDYNHLAFTWRGRAGSTVGIKTDSDDEFENGRFDALEIEPEEIKEITKNKEIQKMDSIRIKDKDFEVSEAAAIAISHKFDSDKEQMETFALRL